MTFVINRSLQKKGKKRYCLELLSLANELPSATRENSESAISQASLTAQKIQEKKINDLNHSLSDFRNAIYSSSIVSRTDHTGKIIFVNENFVRISGYSEDELLGQNHRIISSGFHSRKFWSEMWRTIASGNIWRAEVKNKAKDGSYYWVDTFIMPFIDSNGHIHEYLSIRNDITERKQTALALEHSLKSLADSFDFRFEKFGVHLPGFIYQYRLRPDGTAHLPFASKAIITIFGITPEVLQEDASAIFDRIHVDDRERISSAIRISAEKLSDWHQEYRVVHTDGRIIWVEDFSTPQLLEDNSIVWSGYLTDITARKKIELNLKESRDRYLSIIDHLPGFVFRIDAKTNVITFFNGQVREIIGHSAEHFLMKSISSWRNLVHPDDISGVDKSVNGSIATRTRYECEYRLKTPQGLEKWIWERGKGIYSESGELQKIEGFATDISAQKKAEERIRLALKEKELLVKEIHHRVKNNLQVISSIIYLKSTSLKNIELKSFFEETRQKIRAISLIHERLLETENVSEIEISDYLRRLIKDLERLNFKDETGIVIEFRAEPVSVNLDQAIYCGLILNELVTNSIKHAFTDEISGRITISLTRTSTGFEFVISDNGISLPEGIEPGSTTSFGMQLLYIFIKQLHANFSINRQAGTTFRITFPEYPYAKR